MTCPEKEAIARWCRALSIIPMSSRFVLYKLLEGSEQENHLMKSLFRESSGAKARIDWRREMQGVGR